MRKKCDNIGTNSPCKPDKLMENESNANIEKKKEKKKQNREGEKKGKWMKIFVCLTLTSFDMVHKYTK